MSLEIDELIHQSTRTRIMTSLANFGEIDYTTLKKTLSLTDGHMSTHMKKLVDAKYVVANKSFLNQKPLTKYRLSKLGKKRLFRYFETLKNLFE